MTSPTTPEFQRYKSVSYVHETQILNQTRQTALVAAAVAGAIVALSAALTTVWIQFGGLPVGTIGQNCLYGTLGLGGTILLIDSAVYAVLRRQRSQFEKISQQKAGEKIQDLYLVTKKYVPMPQVTDPRIGTFHIYYEVNQDNHLICHIFDKKSEERNYLGKELTEKGYRHGDMRSDATLKGFHQPEMQAMIEKNRLDLQLNDQEFCWMTITGKVGRYYAVFLNINKKVEFCCLPSKDAIDMKKQEYKAKYKEREDLNNMLMQKKSAVTYDWKGSINRIEKYKTNLESNQFYTVKILDVETPEYLLFFNIGKGTEHMLYFEEKSLEPKINQLKERNPDLKIIDHLCQAIFDPQKLVHKLALAYMQDETKKLGQRMHKPGWYCDVTLKDGEKVLATAMIVREARGSKLTYYTKQAFGVVNNPPRYNRAGPLCKSYDVSELTS